MQLKLCWFSLVTEKLFNGHLTSSISFLIHLLWESFLKVSLLQNFHHVCGPGFIYERVSAHHAEGLVHKLQWTMERYRHRFEKFYFNLQDKFSSIFVTNLNNIYLPSFFKGQVRCLNFNSCKGSRYFSFIFQAVFIF